MTGPFHQDAFDARRLGLEEEYFRSRDSQLVSKLKTVFHAGMTKEELRKSTGISDEALLERLAAANVRCEMLVAFKVYPLVEIAWADGSVDSTERTAVLDSAAKSGVAPGSEAMKCLEGWLANGPSKEMRQLWQMYAAQLKKSLTAQELATFRSDLVSYATKVAEASGGILRIVWKISPAEQAALDSLMKQLS
jgi:hypothetical protein